MISEGVKLNVCFVNDSQLQMHQIQSYRHFFCVLTIAHLCGKHFKIEWFQNWRHTVNNLPDGPDPN